jgi:hypothetical protein
VSNPYTLTGLSANSNYGYYVTANCPGPAQSTLAGPKTFVTLCNAISSFPFTENFNGVTTPALPSCFSQNDANADGDKWITYTTYGVGGTQCAGLYTDFNSGANNDYLIFPQFNLSGNQRLRFSVRARSSGEPNDYRVVLSTTDNSPASFTTELLALQTVSSTTMTEITPIDLSSYSGNVWIAIQVPSGGADGYYLYIDDITVEAIPSCPGPSGISVGSITVSGASVSWSGTGTFILEYGATGFTPGTGASAGTGGTLINPATSAQVISGLAFSTGYDVYVRQDCTGSASGYSANSGVNTFTTLAPPPANDECATATTINTVSISSTNNGATQTLAAGTCGGSAAITTDVWFQFTAGSNGDATVNVMNVSALFDPVIEVYSGTCGSFTNIGCADLGSGGGSEVAALTGLVAGQTYYVRVYGYSTSSSTGTFDISVTGAALPISIEYFKGSKQNNGHLLDWKVACSSSPSVTLQLERSADGRNFNTINSQSATATRCLQPFSYTDAAPLAGVNYYRLKSIDIDGKITYSTIVALLNKDKGFEIVSLMPNPAKEVAVLSVTSAVKSIIEIVVSDMNGKQLSKQRVSLIAGNNQLPLNVRSLASGTYQVTGITADGISKTLRFVKQ